MENTGWLTEDSQNHVQESEGMYQEDAETIGEREASATWKEGIVPVAAVCWLCGLCLMLGYMVFSWIRLHRSLQTAVPETVNLSGRQVKVYRAENIESPFLLGAFSPKIYLPYTVVDGEIEYVLEHELMHIRRRDYLLKPLSFLVLSIYWFHPLVWVAYVLLGRDIELACDEQVLREKPELDRTAYAQALLSCGNERRRISVCPVAFGESDVKRRVKNVLNYKKPGFWIVLGCVVLCIGVVLCFMTVSEDAPEKHTATQEPAQAGESTSIPTTEPTSKPTAEPAPTATAAPTAEPTAEPSPTPTTVPTPEPSPVPTVVPEDYVPEPIAGYTESQSKQIRDELSGRIVYEISDDKDMSVWLDSTEYGVGTSLDSMFLSTKSGMKFHSLDIVNHIEALEMDGEDWLAVTLIPNVLKDGGVFLYEEKAMELMIPVSIQDDGKVVLENYYPKRYSTFWQDDLYMYNLYMKEKYIYTRLHLMQADVTHDGIDDNIEIFIYFPPKTDMTEDIDTLIGKQIMVDNVIIQVYDGSTATEDSLGTPILCSGYSTAHVGNGQLNLVRKDGLYYLVETSLWMGQGAYSYHFNVLTLDKEGHQYIIDSEYLSLDMRTDTNEEIDRAIADFRDRLEPWIEDGQIVVATEVGLYPADEYMITTERRQYESREFYDKLLKGVR